MINLPRYQEKGILLSYLLNQDVSEIIIHHLKVADQASEVTFRESNQEIFRREYDWSIPMDQLSMNYRRIHGDYYRGVWTVGRTHRFVAYVLRLNPAPTYPAWVVSRSVREAVTAMCRTHVQPTPMKNTNKPRNVIYDPIKKRNNRKGIARSNRVMGKHMKNR
jgi:hypothetical protein